MKMLPSYNSQQKQERTHSHFLDALYYYEKLVTFCGTEVNSGLNKLYQIQSAGIPGNITQAIDNRMFSNQPDLGHNLPGVHILRAVNYASHLINLNLCSWINVLTIPLLKTDYTQVAEIPIQSTPFNEFLYDLLGGIQVYGRFNPNPNVCHKLEELGEAIFDVKRKQDIPFNWHYNNVRTIMESAVALVNHQLSHLSIVGGKSFPPQETNAEAVKVFLKSIPLSLSIFRNDKDILLMIFRIVYALCRLRSGCVAEPKQQQLLTLTHKLANMRISDTTVACIPFPVAEVLGNFEENDSSRIGRYALFYVDRLTVFYKQGISNL